MNHIEIRAPLNLSPAAAGALPTRFDGIAYSGGLVLTLGVVIDLASTSVADRLPLLHQHVCESVIGAVTANKIADGLLTVEERLFSDSLGGRST